MKMMSSNDKFDKHDETDDEYNENDDERRCSLLRCSLLRRGLNSTRRKRRCSLLLTITVECLSEERERERRESRGLKERRECCGLREEMGGRKEEGGVGAWTEEREMICGIRFKQVILWDLGRGYWVVSSFYRHIF